ncbi:PLP-dependent aminotransferase family protein [Martelella endophytica]|uniref:GntR family transcriptional regulator n=1 Tax=Martelella endophytica TaxID=1486262 RepID=A0A0D5LRI3_MAREN|nr:PLP-dependent aminotransferase family protein [Martelella endophytica]AJY46849.1 GntR family transcriptional regulator [Martelella endophytica]
MLDWEKIYATRTKRMGASEIRELLKLLEQPDIISFAGGIPDPALFPSEDFQEAYNDILSGPEAGQALQYSVSEGYPRLREWIVQRMRARGINADIGNIFITSGSQQGLDYLGKLLLSPGDTALVTWPTYLGALQAFNAYEPRYDKLDLSRNASPEDYAAAARDAGSRVKFAYLSADFANPSGESLTPMEREKLLDIAEALDIAVIEDAAYRALRYDGERQKTLLTMDCERNGGIENTRTLYCGSFSKTLSPGLRVGWICAATPVIKRLVLAKQAADLHSPTINQMAIARVAEKSFNEQAEKITRVYGSRRDAMLDALAKHMPAGVHWHKPEGGMFIWLTMPEHIDSAALLALSLKTAKVAFVPGNAFYADGSGGNHMRLSFSCSSPEVIEEGIGRLGALLAEQLAAAA